MSASFRNKYLRKTLKFYRDAIKKQQHGNASSTAASSGWEAKGRSYHDNVEITATPRVALNDIAPKIIVRGLFEQLPFTLRAQMLDDRGKKLLSNAHYVSNSEGEIDVFLAPSLGGSYEGVFPTGLISTLKSADNTFEYGRVIHDDVEKPLKITIEVQEGHQPLQAESNSITSLTLERHFVSPGVKRYPVRDGRVRGVLFIPAGDGYFPGVIEMYGAIGTFLTEQRGALLASRGIAALSLAYFNYEDIPAEKLGYMDMEYFEEATHFLRSQPKVIPDRIGVLSNCYGGVLGHHMAIHIDEVKALFSINVGYRHFGTFTKDGNPLYDDFYLPMAGDNLEHIDEEDQRFIPTPEFSRDFVDTRQTYVKDLVKVAGEKYFSYTYGEDDPYPFMVGQYAIKKAVGKHYESNFTSKTYPYAGHIIDPPYTPTIDTSFMRMHQRNDAEGKVEMKGFIHYWGGKSKESVEMQKDTWQNALKFFNHHIRDCSPWYQNWLRNKSKL